MHPVIFTRPTCMATLVNAAAPYNIYYGKSVAAVVS
jgi:hypothetical protein